MGNYLLSLQPTFTQGFLLGQISVLFLLALILKYLFWHTGPEPQLVSLPPRTERKPSYDPSNERGAQDGSIKWLNTLLLQVTQTYRAQLSDHLEGTQADDVVRQKIEEKLNEARPSSFTDPIRVHSVDLGSSAPTLSAMPTDELTTTEGVQSPTKFHVTYQDTVSISLSTSILLHYPRPYFARLPVSLTLSLAMFSSKLILVFPEPQSQKPSVTFTLPPDFTLDIHTNSLLGSRAKLADVPKVHEMIESQIRRYLMQHGTWTIFLPLLNKGDEAPHQ